jgi:large subunit ribosomal protein L20
MARSTNAPASNARKKKYYKAAKGYFGRRKNVWTVTKNAVEKGWEYAYVGRRNKKRDFRALWIARINAAAREHGLSYSQFMHKLHEKHVDINRKTLADLALNNPSAFEAIIASVK